MTNNTDMIFLSELDAIIRDRMAEPSAKSYTATLVATGTRRVAQKVGEEAIELSLAAVAGSRSEQIDEAADLLFHLQVLLATLGLSLTDVVQCLQERHCRSRNAEDK
jgi:phosphoribosyl-ATP pyrophosphohydrolase/phosphoribosyl-AMP cyclohydrolase